MADIAVLLPRLAALFGVGGLYLLALRHRDDIAVLTSRLRSWAVIAVVWFAAVGLGRPGVTALAVACAGVAAAEYGRLAVPAAARADRALLVVGASLLPAITPAGGAAWVAAVVTVLLGATVPPLVAQDVSAGWDRIARTWVGVLWIGGACAALAVLPLEVLPLVGVATALADVGGFVGGAALRRNPLAGRRLAPALSPGKTLGGVLGAAAGGTAGVVLCADVAGLPLALAPLLGVGMAVAATWGDLLESLLKRSAGAKDAGSWLPGFGGLLDRLDSLLVIAPISWLLVEVVGR